MSKIYAVTAGQYSDYHIVALTTNKEIAEAKMRVSKEYDVRIEEYDDLQDFTIIEESKKVKPKWEIEINVHGKIVSSKICTYSQDEELEEDIIRFTAGLHSFFYVFADDKEHAEKIASDRRAKAIAEYFNL